MVAGEPGGQVGGEPQDHVLVVAEAAGQPEAVFGGLGVLVLVVGDARQQTELCRLQSSSLPDDRRYGHLRGRGRRPAAQPMLLPATTSPGPGAPSGTGRASRCGIRWPSATPRVRRACQREQLRCRRRNRHGQRGSPRGLRIGTGDAGVTVTLPRAVRAADSCARPGRR
jgi:hypothetical protein